MNDANPTNQIACRLGTQADTRGVLAVDEASAPADAIAGVAFRVLTDPTTLDFFLGSGGLLVAEADGRIAGYALICPIARMHGGGPLAWVEHIGVPPDLRQRGVGSALLDFAGRHFSGRANCLHAAVHPANTASLTLFRRAGATEAQRVLFYKDIEPLAEAAMTRSAVPAPGMEIIGPTPASAVECEAILRSLPEWFGMEPAIQQYVRDVQMLPTFTARGDGRTIGFLTIKRHSRASAEVSVMAVAREHRGRGAGRRLLAAAEAWLAEQGVRFLQVKTLGPSRSDEHYAQTHRFYEAAGFVPLEEFPLLWDKNNPCLLMVKCVHAATVTVQGKES